MIDHIPTIGTQRGLRDPPEVAVERTQQAKSAEQVCLAMFAAYRAEAIHQMLAQTEVIDIVRQHHTPTRTPFAPRVEDRKFRG
ncbi:MAG: hypothetical protein U0V87_03100 [Acidobacteriota bacterium]